MAESSGDRGKGKDSSGRTPLIEAMGDLLKRADTDPNSGIEGQSIGGALLGKVKEGVVALTDAMRKKFQELLGKKQADEMMANIHAKQEPKPSASSGVGSTLGGRISALLGGVPKQPSGPAQPGMPTAAPAAPSVNVRSAPAAAAPPPPPPPRRPPPSSTPT
jgi:hypothetical protein